MTAEERRKKHQLELKEQLHEEAKVGLLMILIDNYCYSKTKWTITTKVYIIISQWELKKKTSRQLEARENANDEVTNALVLYVIGQEDIGVFLTNHRTKLNKLSWVTFSTLN